MNTRGHLFRHPGCVALAGVLVLLLLAAPAGAQLAITEMMLKSEDTLDPALANANDFWELTNFGTDTVNLAGYTFKDSSNKPAPLVGIADPPLFIRGGESVIFARKLLLITGEVGLSVNEARFREWWGACLGAGFQFRCYTNFGFSRYGDSLALYDPGAKLVDTIDFGEATLGVSFVYDPDTGAFGDLSINGKSGACRAATANDVASPGVATGPVPLRIVQHPANLVACAGLDATFKVGVIGMPRPRYYQWFFNGTPLFGQNKASLTVTNVSAVNEGAYSVSVGNGFTTLLGSSATLTVNMSTSGPVILARPMDATVVTNRTARFSISVCAWPVATYQWLSNGVALADATSRTLLIPNCTLDMSGAEFCVRAKNPLGTQTACARLYVTIKPDLRFTEVQAYPVTGTNCAEHHDWFEVTNFGTNAVDLLGYRFFDKFNLARAKVVTQPMVLQPHESAVFVKNPTLGAFLDWWGATLPVGLKLFPYGGFSLSKDGDELYLWSATAEDINEYIDSKSFAASSEGVSLRFDQDFAYFGVDNIPGEFGAFRAERCGDIGSPGYTANHGPRFVSINRVANGAYLKWHGVEGKTYRLDYNTNAQATGWLPVGKITASNSLPAMIDKGGSNIPRRFYRVVEVLP